MGYPRLGITHTSIVYLQVVWGWVCEDEVELPGNLYFKLFNHTVSLINIQVIAMTILGMKQPSILYSSLVVVSAVTGFISSHVVDQALSVGFRVRGTTRSLRKKNPPLGVDVF